MKKRIIISLFLLLGLASLAIFMNFDKSVEAAYLGAGMPDGTNYQTLRYMDGQWFPSSALTNNGADIVASGSITADSFIYLSDRTLKDNIKVLDNSLEKIKNLEGVSFTWKDNGKEEIGLIAQDVEVVVPELVVTNEDGLKAVKYGNIVALLIEAVKDQQVEIDELRQELNSLK